MCVLNPVSWQRPSSKEFKWEVETGWEKLFFEKLAPAFKLMTFQWNPREMSNLTLGAKSQPESGHHDLSVCQAPQIQPSRQTLPIWPVWKSLPGMMHRWHERLFVAVCNAGCMYLAAKYQNTANYTAPNYRRHNSTIIGAWCFHVWTAHWVGMKFITVLTFSFPWQGPHLDD